MPVSKSGPSQSIQGSWRGQYFYAHDPSTGFGFEAVFVDINGVVEGNILDDGVLGEADVAGSFHYPTLKFTKIYRGRHSVQYQGTMTEDGNELFGRWHIGGGKAVSGTWRAFRFEDGTDLKLEDIEGVSEDAEQETVQPALAPSRPARS